MNLLDQEWDFVVSLGIKCNLAPILKVTGKRYISSPFDNMDSVEGLVEAGDLIAQRFKDYFENIDQWHVRNDYPPRSNEVRAKIIWHQDFPNLYYPHVATRWFDPETAAKIPTWIADPEGTLNLVWDGLKTTFVRRQERLVHLLSAGKRVLFLRADDRTQARRLAKCSLNDDIKSFCTALSSAYPSLDFGLLYLSCQLDSKSEDIGDVDVSAVERSTVLKIPAYDSEVEFVERIIRQLKVLPRDHLTLAVGD